MICNFAHSGEAHLGKEIEVVLIHNDDFRTMLPEGRLKSFLRIIQHRVPHLDGKTGLPQKSSGIESAERRIRLHFPHLFAVVVEVIRMC